MDTVLSKLLGVEGFGRPLGPNAVGTRTCRIPGGCFARLFYPIHQGPRQGKPYQYMRTEAINGVADSIKTPRWMLKAWKSARHPFLEDAAMSKDFAGPVICFSHGLFGNAEMYTKLCSDLASHGMLVVACEHEDGSASYCAPSGGRPMPFKEPPAGMQYTRENAIAFRRPFLEQREREVLAVLRYCVGAKRRASAGSASLDDIVLTDATEGPGGDGGTGLQLLKDLPAATQFFLCGHSFGGCSTVFVSRDAFVREHVSGIALLDLWPFPLDHETVGHGLRLPAVSILTGEFVNNDEVTVTRQLLRNTDRSAIAVTALYVPGSMHSQFSDTPWLMAPWLARRSHALGSTRKEDSQRAIVRALVKLFTGSEAPTWDALLQQEKLEMHDFST